MRTLDINTDGASRKFELNLYRFALEAEHAEILQGLPILDLVSSRLSYNYRIYIRSLNPEDRAAFLHSMVEWRHSTILGLESLATFTEKPEILNKCFRACMRPTEEQAREFGYLRRIMKPDRPRLRKPALWAAMRSEIRRLTGDSGFYWGPNERRFTMKFGEWTLDTHLDAGGMLGGLRLFQQIWTADKVFLVRQMSYPGVLGFPFIAEWSLSEAGEEESVARCAAAIAERILTAAPQILEGVSYP